MGVHEYHGADAIVVCLSQEEAVIALRRLLDWKMAKPLPIAADASDDVIAADCLADERWRAAFPFPGPVDVTFDYFRIDTVHLIGLTPSDLIAPTEDPS
jgi:hypothetical protein